MASGAITSLPPKAQQWIKKFESHTGLMKRGLAKAEVSMGRVKDGAVIVAGGCALGAAQGFFGHAVDQGHIRMGKPEDALHGLDLDLVAPLVVLGLGVADQVGEYSDDAVLFAAGALAAYGSNMIREKVAKATVNATAGTGWGD